jgi:ketosteroid isomerase-like protein
VLACDDRVVVARVAYRGHAADGGGEFEVELIWVVVVEDGLFRRGDTYGPADEQPAIARYTELGGGLSKLGDSPLERLYATLARGRGSGSCGDARVRRRRLRADRSSGSELDRHVGRDGFRAAWESALDLSPDLRVEAEEVLAVGERTLALLLRHTGRTARDDGGGEFSLEVGHVATHRGGCFASVDQYDPADREAMLARFGELSDSVTPRSPALPTSAWKSTR